MKRIAFCLFTVLLFLAPVTMSGAPVPQVKKDDLIKDDLTKLEGKWRIVSLQVDGVELNQEGLAILGELTFSGRDYKWSDGSFPGTIEEIDPTQTPKRIAYKIADGAEKGSVHYGIYTIVGDVFVDCFGTSEKDRPREFVSKPESGHILIVYKRIRKEKD
jgi:uncharacterized protein (TIGR03067 family)